MLKSQLWISSLFLLISVTAFSQAPVIGPVSGPNTVCWSASSQSIFSTSASNNPSNYVWNIYPGFGVQLYGQGTGTVSVSFPNVDGNYVITCQAVNGSGASTVSYFNVSVFEKPNVTFSGNTFFCQGSGTNLSASPTTSSSFDSLTFFWTPPAGLNTTTGPNVYANPSSTTNYTVLIGNGPCQSTTAVTVNPILAVSFSFIGTTLICEGYGTPISATSNLSGSSTLSYNWFPSSGLSSTTGQTVTANPAATTMYTVIATDGVCTASNVINITVDACVGIVGHDMSGQNQVQLYPNPNSGSFFLKSIESVEGRIFNELGQVVRQLKFIKDEEVEIEGLNGGVYFMLAPRTRIKIVVLN